MKHKVLIALLLALSLNGCKKKETVVDLGQPGEAPAAAEIQAPSPVEGTAPAPKLTAVEAVRDAMQKKEYSKAVGMVIQMQTVITSEKQMAEVTAIKHEVKMQLIDAGPDPRAKEALAILNGMTLGR